MSQNHSHDEIAEKGSASHREEPTRQAFSEEFVNSSASKGKSMSADAEKQAESVLSSMKLNLETSMSQDAKLGLHTQDPQIRAEIWQNTPDKYLQVNKNDVLVNPAYKKEVVSDMQKMSGEYGLSLTFSDIFGKGDYYATGRPTDKN